MEKNIEWLMIKCQIDIDNKLPDLSKMACVIKDDYKFYPHIFLEEALVS